MNLRDRDKILARCYNKGWNKDGLTVVKLKDVVDILEPFVENKSGSPFCKGAYWIEKAMQALENVPKMGTWYLDEDVARTYNMLDDAYTVWDGECKEHKRLEDA